MRATLDKRSGSSSFEHGKNQFDRSRCFSTRAWRKRVWLDSKRKAVICRPGRDTRRLEEILSIPPTFTPRGRPATPAESLRLFIGRWLAARGKREQTIIATKVGMHPQLKGLSAKTIRTAAENSLKRLQSDYIDLYYAHVDDEQTPLEETLGAFDALVREGKVRYIAASNYTAPRLLEALAVSDRNGLARYVALQQHYNLMERDKYEGELADAVARERLSSIPYFALASGFLTGKYRPGSKVESQRAQSAGAYLNEKGIRVLAAWMRSRPHTAPRSPPSHSPGLQPSQRWLLPSPAHAPPSNSPTCCVFRMCGSPMLNCRS